MLNFTDVSFISNIVLELFDNDYLSDSSFNNVNGHIIVNGRNVNILNSNFAYCNNTGLNGSIFYVKTGSDYFKVKDCRFINNSADYGGAIYIERNVQATPSTFLLFQ